MGLLDTIRRVKASGVKVAAEVTPPVTLAGQKVLLIYLFPALGDAVLVAPVAQALLQAGAQKVGVVVRAAAARILKLVELPLQIIILPEDLTLAPGDPRWKKAATQKAAAEFRQKLSRYTIRVDLTYRDDADGRPWLTDAPYRLGWRGAQETTQSAGLTHSTLDERWQAERHWVRYLLQPLEPLGAFKPTYPLSFKLKKSTSDPDAVVLVPGSRAPEKRWAAAGFIEVGCWAQKEAGRPVKVVGAPNEAPLLKAIAKNIPGAKTYHGAALAPLLAHLKNAAAVVTNDTGPMHFSFLLGTPTVALFTEMSPLCWGPPVADPRFVVLRPPAGPEGQTWSRAVIHYLDGLLAQNHR